MIRCFTIEGFKRFEQETVIALEDVTVLVGANNSGKSTILHALTLFQYCVETTRRTNGNGPEPKKPALARRSVSPDEFGVLPVADPADLWPNGRVRIRGKPNPLSLRAEFSNEATIEFQLRIDYNRFDIVPSVAGHWREAIDGREIRLIPIFSGFLPREEYLTLPARRDRMRLQRHGEMVRNLLWDLREHAGARWGTVGSAWTAALRHCSSSRSKLRFLDEPDAMDRMEIIARERGPAAASPHEAGATPGRRSRPCSPSSNSV